MRDDTQPAPEQADARWLELRVPADNAARAQTEGTLLPRLVRHLAAAGADKSGVEVIDLGSGTGANQRWLAPRLPFEQHWLLIDQDSDLHRQPPDAPRTRHLTADVGILTSIVDRGGSIQLITCSALLDVLTVDQLEAIGSALTTARQPALFSLTVTGVVELWPSHPLDSRLNRAFDDHQRRGGRAGPEAVEVLMRVLRAPSRELRTTETPWLLDRHSDAELVGRFLTDRVDAAVEQAPDLGAAGADWLDRRLAQLAEGALEIEVGHRDLLVLPDG